MRALLVPSPGAFSVLNRTSWLRCSWALSPLRRLLTGSCFSSKPSSSASTRGKVSDDKQAYGRHRGRMRAPSLPLILNRYGSTFFDAKTRARNYREVVVQAIQPGSACAHVGDRHCMPRERVRSCIRAVASDEMAFTRAQVRARRCRTLSVRHPAPPAYVLCMRQVEAEVAAEVDKTELAKAKTPPHPTHPIPAHGWRTRHACPHSS